MIIRSAKALGVPLENSDMLTQRCMDKSPCEVKHHGCADISFPDVNWTVHAVEPRTGIEFPTILDNILEGEKNSSLMSEVKVYKLLKLIAHGLFMVFAANTLSPCILPISLNLSFCIC